MKFKLEIKLGNAGFYAFNGGAIADILKALADEIDDVQLDTKYSGSLIDVNGNTCGNWKVTK